MANFGFNGVQLQRLKSYLSGIKQVVKTGVLHFENHPGESAADFDPGIF